MWKPGSNDTLSPHEFKTQIQRFAPRFMGYRYNVIFATFTYVVECHFQVEIISMYNLILNSHCFLTPKNYYYQGLKLTKKSSCNFVAGYQNLVAI